jgi:radical SAM-linked protein
MRIRVTYQKAGPLLYTSTLDVQTLWERSVRRAGLKLQYSQGFHPQPRIQIAKPLPLGILGERELIDIWLVDEKKPDEIIQRFNNGLPEGMRVTQVELVEENGPSLPKQIDASEYRVDLLNNAETVEKLQKAAEEMLSKAILPRVRNRKAYDLRPLIQELTIQENTAGNIAIFLIMPSNSSQTGRPEEVMAELGIPLEDFRVTRTRLIFAEKYA